MELNKFDNILKDAGIQYSELTPDEKQLYHESVLQIRDLSLDDIGTAVQRFRYAVELQLVDTPDDEEHRDTNCKLKARLKNYIVLEMFLLDPKIRKEQMINQLKNAKLKV